MGSRAIETKRDLAKHDLAKHLAALFACLAWFASVWAVVASAQDGPVEPPAAKTAAPRIAVVIPVPLPIAGDVDTKLSKAIKSAADALLRNGPANPRPILILEFKSKDDATGEGSSFGRCLDLARELTGDRMSQVRTIAFLPKSVKGHAVLPVLACEELIMDDDAELGAAGIDEARVEPTVRQGYEEIANRRRTIPAAVAISMLDKNAKLMQLKTADGQRFALEADLAEIQRNTVVTSSTTVVPEGQMGLFDGAQMVRQFGLATHIAADRPALAKALGLPPERLTENATLAGELKAVRIPIDGPIHGNAARHIKQLALDVRAKGNANVIIFSIRSGGGEVDACQSLAAMIAEDLPDMRTIAYVHREARGPALMCALAANELVMEEGAILGGPDRRPMLESRVEDLAPWWKEWADRRGKTWSLPMAMMGDTKAVFKFTHADGTVRVMSDDEHAAMPDAAQWNRSGEVAVRLGISAAQAVEFGLAKSKVPDLPSLERSLALDNPARVVRTNWVLKFVESLADPRLSGILLFIAMFAFFTELSTPGLGVPGFIALVAFSLFFWANFLHGTADWLEIVLFAVGVLCVCVELFIVPGSMIFGFGGGVMILIALVLASQTFVIPANVSQLQHLPVPLFSLVFAGFAALIATAWLQQYLPRTPYLKNLILHGPTPEEAIDRSRREHLANYEHLMGQQGVAMTPLVPSGKVRFGDETISVQSDGELIAVGSQVEVIDVFGSRVIVRAIG